MIALRKLGELSPGHRRRKLALTLEAIERERRSGRVVDVAYCLGLLGLLSADENLSEAFRIESRDAERVLRGFGPPGSLPGAGMGGDGTASDPLVRILNRVRRNLGKEIGRDPADWDFVAPDGSLDPSSRRPFEGFRAYLEDVRSPFNVGSVFRSADAFGVGELLLSGFTADPGHPRAERTAMGTTRTVPWRRAVPGDLEGLGALVALELGGTELDEFEFPVRGVLVVGSEELGVSPELLSRCESRVTVAMRGSKASINLGVAFGIVARTWSAALARR
ncbi:MAG: TrmH family RNA methyltransferase [Spirochaetes bacterium]|nr:TrmH family RNA methyltransferase [Spirochaetota bacterium]